MRRERDELMSRMMKMTTGYGMQERIPTQEEIRRMSEENKRQPRTVTELMQHLEKDSLESYLKAQKKPKAQEKPNGEESGDTTATTPTSD